jgi:hypothetical protein
VTFHDQLPGIGKTIHYEIELKEFFRQGDTWLFRFEFEATVDGQPLITMKEGCAGFFTQQELDSGKGIVESKMERQIRRGVLPADFRELAPMKVESLDGTQVEALRKGDLVAAFGQQFAGLHWSTASRKSTPQAGDTVSEASPLRPTSIPRIGFSPATSVMTW